MKGWYTSPLSAHATSSSEEHVENVHGRAEAAATSSSIPTLFNGRLSSSIVHFSFLCVRQHLVRLRDLFKLETQGMLTVT